MAKIIAGLGNIGVEYSMTRHNVGFWIVDRLAQAWELDFEQGEGSFELATRKYKGEYLHLIKPTNYMNNSGQSLKKATAKLGVDPAQMMVVYDDIHLEVGKIRMRAAGSDGGHNGIKDIIQRFGTKSFPRLRIGVGNDFPQGRLADYVLSNFDLSQQPLVEDACDQAEKALITWLKGGINHAMNQFNS
jgi:PTH1 family peptidyl-tRNA hydrolase